MTQTISQNIINAFRRAEATRRPYESVFAQLSKYYAPYRDDFIGSFPRTHSTRAAPRSDLFDTEGANAAEQLAATICSGLINYADPWFNIQALDPSLAEDVSVRRFLEQATLIMRAAINETSANFYSVAHEFILDLVVYGNAGMYVDENTSNNSIRFSIVPCAALYFSEDHTGRVDSVFRLMKMTQRQVVTQWPDCSSELKTQAVNEPDRLITIVHAVFDKSHTDKIVDKRKPYSSYYFPADGEELLSSNGFMEMPYIVARWARRAGDVYGRSPAWTALPDVKQANAIRKTLLETAERMGNPPILVSDDGVLTQVRLVPGQPVVGGLDSISQQPRLQPMMVGGNLPVTQQLLELTHQNIRDRFFIGSLQTYNPNVEKTATEIIEFRREETRLMGPQIGKIQTEMLEPVLIRVRGILQRQGKFPELPEQLAGVNIRLDFTSPLSHLQQYSDIEAIQRTVQSVLPFLQIDPNLMDNFDIDRTFQHIANVNGVPAGVLRSPEEVAQLRASREQQQQAAQMTQGLQMLGDASASFAKANSLINGS
jgi:hypothetical protein